MAYAVLLQALMTLVIAALAAAVAGSHAALSALLGGLACVVPNGLFAWRLAWDARRPGGATVQGFVVGEFVKLVATVAILFAAGRLYRDIVWPALIIGFVAVLKSYWLMFVVGRRRA